MLGRKMGIGIFGNKYKFFVLVVLLGLCNYAGIYLMLILLQATMKMCKKYCELGSVKVLHDDD